MAHLELEAIRKWLTSSSGVFDLTTLQASYVVQNNPEDYKRLEACKSDLTLTVNKMIKVGEAHWHCGHCDTGAVYTYNGCVGHLTTT